MDEVNNRFRNRIEDWLKKHHNVGETVGGSGHLGSVSLGVLLLEQTESNGRIIVKVEYDISVETEFSYYPDNPPRYTKYMRIFEFDGVGELKKIHESEVLETNIDLDLPNLLDDDD
ncbi:MAG: hypothetical protein ACTSU3_06370 [Candidatus Thorarchaeota archaeon]